MTHPIRFIKTLTIGILFTSIFEMNAFGLSASESEERVRPGARYTLNECIAREMRSPFCGW
jgi:hypothetical protein